MATTLGLTAPKKPNREQVRSMGELVHSRMSHGGARILTELEHFIAIVRQIAAKGMERAETEDQSVGCKHCGKKPDSGFRLALDAAMVGTKQWETVARVLSEVQDRQQVHIVHLAASPEWERLRRAIAQALVPYPDAARAVAAALRATGNDEPGVQDAEIIETPPQATSGFTPDRGFAGQR